MALVRDSAGRGGFLLVDFLVAEISAALVTVVSVDAIATFAILMEALSISAAPALDISDYSYDYPYSYYNDNGYLSVERAVQEELAKLGYYYGPLDGTIGPETLRAIRWFQSVDKIPVSGLDRQRNVESAADQLRAFLWVCNCGNYFQRPYYT